MTATSRLGERRRWRSMLPGLGLAVVLAAVATVAAPLLPLIGAPVLGVLLGLAVALLRWRRGGPDGPRRSDRLAPGLRWSGSRVLQVAVVLLGAQLSWEQVADAGVAALPVLVAVIVAALVGAWLLGQALGVDRDLRTLLGVGTAICGASAIAAVTPVLRPTADKVAYALSTVFACNIAAVLAFPVLGQLAGLSPEAFGILVGAAVNDTSSVLAAASAFGPEAADTAVVVKLTRTLAIIPIVLGLSVLVARWARVDNGRSGSGTGPQDGAVAHAGRPPVWRLVPWFLTGFVLLVVANSLGLVPGALHDPVTTATTFFITVALSAVGAGVDIAGLRRTGARPMVLGVGLWLGVTGAALGAQAATGTLT
ncbi:YeiH family protein [Pseudactinotalea sp. Z1732]|uniref:YeiH family protein n=1 Tax=Micrococcales TaxID=85006 RepID=UPI003C7CB41E